MKKTKKIAISLAILISCASLMANWVFLQDNSRLHRQVDDLLIWKEKQITESELLDSCETNLNSVKEELAKTAQELEQLKKN